MKYFGIINSCTANDRGIILEIKLNALSEKAQRDGEKLIEFALSGKLISIHFEDIETRSKD